MGIRNYLVEGVSGAGKTAVCDELRRRGHQAIHGDRELAYRGDPETGLPAERDDAIGEHIWDVARVQELVADRTHPVTFFCGGSRNHSKFIGLFDGVFILEVDLETMLRRIDERVRIDPTDWGGQPEERALSIRLHETKEQVPDGCVVDATRPLVDVTDEILRRIGV
ncbi:AAA family ATPase [Nocardioides sp. NPDC051685]|uniref:AAA family ATPase n=1 Tax=Nocardioides sp. NPDC051685 TaxID=3364334 RepID=UPI003788467D